MKSRSFVSVIISLVLLTTSGQAGVIPGRWEKVDAQSRTAGLQVLLKSGERINCFFKAADSDSLIVADPVAGERRLPKSAVVRVETIQDGRDTVADGTLIGFGAGAGGYLGIHAVACCSPNQAHDLWAALTFGGIGALVGFALDVVSRRSEVLYVAK